LLAPFQLYLYAPREKQVDALCTLGPLSYCNSVYGMSIGRGSWYFKTGEWTDIRQDIWLNTPGVADGGFNIWFVSLPPSFARFISPRSRLANRAPRVCRINNELVLTSSSVYYRSSVVGKTVNNGTAGSNMTLIDYDAIPDHIPIPNGGFSTLPVDLEAAPIPLPIVTVSSTATTNVEGQAYLNGPRLNPTDWANKRNVVRFASKEVKEEQELTKPEPTMVIRQGSMRGDDGPAGVKAEVEKRATATSLPTGFKGIMFSESVFPFSRSLGPAS
jgi:hypothetical protein